MQELLYQVTQQDIGYIEVGLVGHVNFKADNTLAIKAKDTRDTTSPRSPDSLAEGKQTLLNLPKPMMQMENLEGL